MDVVDLVDLVDVVDRVDVVDFYLRKSACIRGSVCWGPFGVAVDDEAGVFGYLIVEAAGGFVGFVRVPVDAGGARVFGLFVNSVNLGFAYSFSSRCFGGE